MSGSERRVIELATLRRFAKLDGDTLYHSVRAPREVESAGVRDMLASLTRWAVPIEDVAKCLRGGGLRSASLEKLRAVYSGSQNLITLARINLRKRYDLILVEQGYGGVYVHSYELVKRLRDCGLGVLLLSPEEPMFEADRHEDDLTLGLLQEVVSNIDYFTYVHVMRGVVNYFRGSPVLIAHRSQSLLLFDLLSDRKSVIYCDGFMDGGFAIAKDSRVKIDDDLERRIVDELYFLVANSGRGFHSFHGGPGTNQYLLLAGYAAMTTTGENWFWGNKQHSDFMSGLPELASTSALVLPFTQPTLFRGRRAKRRCVVLFTTTMHNIDKKGFPELINLMERLPSLSVDCIVRQPHFLPDFPEELGDRLRIRSVAKTEMIDLYHEVWCNLRTSREESSPLSILEGMVCEIPQIVSPAVAEQIPIIEDGATGFVVNPDDPDRLLACVSELMASRSMRDRMGKECRKRALTLALEERIDTFALLLEGAIPTLEGAS